MPVSNPSLVFTRSMPAGFLPLLPWLLALAPAQTTVAKERRTAAPAIEENRQAIGHSVEETGRGSR